MAATNKGTCQICGAVQKLPKGRLAQHGYKVQWSQFNGICSGSKNLPYEESCEMIKDLIVRCKKEVEGMKRSIASVMNKPGTDTAWEIVYIPAIKKRGWMEVPLIIGEDGRPYYQAHDGANVRCTYSTNIPSYVEYQKKLRIEPIEQAITREERHIAWQEARVASWKPAELLPL